MNSNLSSPLSFLPRSLYREILFLTGGTGKENSDMGNSA